LLEQRSILGHIAERRREKGKEEEKKLVVREKRGGARQTWVIGTTAS
jgi:hypothetical protein